jgi:hypothetical protein
LQGLLRITVPLLALLSMAIFLASCGGDAATATPTPTPTTQPLLPQESLSASATRMSTLKSLSFSMTHETGASPLMSGVTMDSLEGQAALPDRFSLDVKAQAAAFRAFINIQIIAAEGKAYMTNPISGQWQETNPAALPFNFANLGGTVAGIINAIM